MEQQERAGRRRIGVAAALAGGVAVVALLAGWIERKPIVAHFVDRSLADAHVRGSYKLTAIGPFAQTLDDVRIGDPTAPDLTARHVELHLGYGLHGPYLASISARGVRLAARVIDGRVSLGAIDRLLPAATPNQPLALPDIAVDIDDTRIALATPAGAIDTAIEGRGKLRDGFHGTLGARAPLLAVSGCAIRGMTATLDIKVNDRRPTLAGPADLAAIMCPRGDLALSKGRATINAHLAASLNRGEGGVSLAGFAGRAGAARFGAVSGLVTAKGDAQELNGHVGIGVADPESAYGQATEAMLGGAFRLLPSVGALAFSGDATLRDVSLAADRRREIAQGFARLEGTPAAPLAEKLGGSIDALAKDANAAAHVSLTTGGPDGAGLVVRTLALAGRDGSFARMPDEGAGIGWSARDGAWRIDGHLVTGGGGLPSIDLRVRQGSAGQPIAGVATLAPYAARDARLTLAPVRFSITGRDTHFSTVVGFDGPLPSGRVSGFTLPIAGRVDARGGIAIDPGCVPLSFRMLATGGIRLDPARVTLCGVGGGAILTRTAAGAIGFGLSTRDVRLTGRSGASPLLFTAGQAQFSAAGVAASTLAVRIGAGDAVTRLDVATLVGSLAGGRASGTFENASAGIAHVPLLFDRMTGQWRIAGGALLLGGDIAVSDTNDPPRFKPLIAHGAGLTFAGGRIDAHATMREPATDTAIADFVVRHDLGSGTGFATLAVPGITFVPKALQPEALTSLTLGVIANVAGTVAGQGRIDWTEKGVASSGDFHTNSLDFAAAFGPVSKVAGAIHFSDLLGLVTPPRQMATIAEANPGIAVSNGVIHYQLLPGQRVRVEDGHWPLAGGSMDLEPTTLAFDETAERHLTFRVAALDAATFVQQLDFPNVSATGTFDGVLPMIFDQTGGRIEGGFLRARKGGGEIAYVGELSTAQIGTMGKLAFDALKKIRYQSLSITLDGKLDGEIVSSVKFDGVHQATGERSLVARMIANLPFRFNIGIRAPFRSLMGSARAFVDPSVLLKDGAPVAPPPDAPPASLPKPIQPAESEPVR